MNSEIPIKCNINEYGKEVTMLVDFEKISKNISTGISVSSEPFFVEFPANLGHSMWVIMIYPNGQYNSSGFNNKQVSIYLKMISAQHEEKILNSNILFELTPEYYNYRKSLNKKMFLADKIFCYENKKQRWVGGILATRKEIDDAKHWDTDKIKIVCKFEEIYKYTRVHGAYSFLL